MVPIDVERARAHARRVLESDTFAKAPSLRRLLAYVVDETLDGRADALKEYTIGVEVFGRGDGFDPRADTIVRVQARRFRAKLEQYYAIDGHADGLAIHVPNGGYLPRFREAPRRRLPPRQPAPGTRAVPLPPADDPAAPPTARRAASVPAAAHRAHRPRRRGREDARRPPPADQPAADAVRARAAAARRGSRCRSRPMPPRSFPAASTSSGSAR